MKVRSKVSIMILLAWLVTAIVVYLGSQFIIKQSFLNLEEESATNNIQRVHQAIQQMQRSVGNALGSWAIWDDTYQFMTNKNKQYINSNLKISSFTSSDVDMVLYFDTNGKPFFMIAADSTRTKESPVPKELLTYILNPANNITRQKNINSNTEGLILTPSGILIVAAHPIVTSNNTGPTHGTLVMARYFTSASLNQLREITKVNINIYPVTSILKNSDLSSVQQALKSASYYIQRPNIETIVVYSLLYDINGNTIAVIKTDWKRSIYQLGLKTVNYYTLLAIIFSVLLLLTLWASLHSFVIKRLEQLNNNMITAKPDAEIKHLVKKDISDEVTSVAMLYHHATHDPLTGLGNRHLIYQTFANRLATLKANHKIVLMFIDLDHFKYVNDTLGHEIGDLLLIHVSEQLSGSLRHDEIAIRLGGDEFVVMLFDVPEQDIEKIVNRIFNLLKKDVNLSGHEVHVSASMGISIYPDNSNDISSLLKNADIALYHAKECGRDQYRYYSSELSKAILEANRKELELQRAIDNKELCLYYQPIYNTRTKEIINLEALIRWNHPEKGLLAASEIIPLAEKSGLIIPIGKWVLKTACAQMQAWQQKGFPDIGVAVNLSLLQIKNSSINKLVSEILTETGLNPQRLEIELTETSYVELNNALLHELRTLKNKGVRFAVDDFGAGYSGLAYLKSLPINKLKIDQSFIKDIFNNADDRAITLAIIAIAHQLNLKVVAEGVETDVQYQFLLKNAVDAVQGNYFCKPLDAESCEKLIKKVYHHS